MCSVFASAATGSGSINARVSNSGSLCARFRCNRAALTALEVHNIFDSGARMKRFMIGFVLGVGVMYWYLNHGDALQRVTRGWFEGAAANYRDDKQHSAARDALGESEPHR